MGRQMIADVVGFLAAALVLLTFSVRSMLTLRAVALASNIAFIAYGLMAGLLPIWLLHLCLVPVNVVRGAQELRCHLEARKAPIRLN
jgi:hypothetical protein